MSGSTDGPVALVSGATRGIGLAIVRRLVADGARIAALDLPDASFDDVLQCCPEAAIVRGDVTDAATWADAMAAVAALGRLDILVNNAGIAGYVGALAE
jgi:NAD(P)-dependent dehydrogenase (short-subunit alcohol dehydrogenase family)